MVASRETIALVDACVGGGDDRGGARPAPSRSSARPAVFAVRRGLRVTLPRASGPTGRHGDERHGRARGASPRASTGDAASTPSTTPPPRSRAARRRASAVGSQEGDDDRARRPGRSSDAPTTARRRSDRSGSVTSSRSASTGGTSAARRAGSAAARTLTSVPTSTDTTSVNPSSGTRPVSCMPTAAQHRAQDAPRARARPRRRAPRPTTPTIAACSTIEENTCSGDAPTARSSASSRVRWRTHMEKVLAMMNAPTNSEIPANTSRNVVMNPRTVRMFAVASLAHLVAGHRLAPGSVDAAATGAIRSTSCCSVSPSAACTEIVATVPSGAKAASRSRCRRRRRSRRPAPTPSPISPTTRHGPQLAADHDARSRRRAPGPDARSVADSTAISSAPAGAPARDHVRGPVPRVVGEPEAGRLRALHGGAVGAHEHQRTLQRRAAPRRRRRPASSSVDERERDAGCACPG